ncbi:Stabilin-1%2C partial [Scomber scombrus]|uniref:Stabilin-1, partial n=1 Tax=Scomber scombrus TaxID=13677 RepID=A0AAV1PT57_SCOSC
MKTLLLLILSLMTGCEATSQVEGCEDGWVEFTCEYPKANQNYKNIEVNGPRGEIKSTKKDKWEKKGGFSLYHDTKNKTLRVAIKQLQQEDFREYKCEFKQKSSEELELELDLVNVKDVCKKPFIQTAYETAKTTITCDYPEKYKSKVKFICKDNEESCVEILSTPSLLKSNGTFTLTNTSSGFNVSISNVSSQHAGVYWCGVKQGRNRASVRQIQLEIKNITSLHRSATIGQTFMYWCKYPDGTPIKKFICKGEDPSICQRLQSTAHVNRNTGKFSIQDDKEKSNITITVRDITTDDTGTYWCGAESTDIRRSNSFFNKLNLTVGCEATSQVEGCEDGWVEFTCEYPTANQNYENIKVNGPRGKIQSTKKDEWEKKDGFSLYHDTKNKTLRVAIKQLQQNDSGEYQCEFKQDSHEELELKLVVVKDVCQKPFIQTAYETAKTTITCDYPDKYKSKVKFICKDNDESCEEILSTPSLLKSNGAFTLTNTNSGFNVSISNVSSQHAGVYWCGVKQGRNRTSVRQIQLEIKNITSLHRSATIGQTFMYWCKYPDGTLIKKFICKGEDPCICQRLQSTAQVNRNTGKFSMQDSKEKRNITITVRDITTDDTGTYWCGAESTDIKRSNPFFNKLNLTVVASIAVPIVAVLLLVLILVLVYKLKVGCQKPFTQTAYETDKTTITCDYSKNYSSFVKFICKDSKIICEEILSTQSSVKSNGTFTLTDTNSGFNMTISNVNSQHTGDYWCGVKSKEGSSRASLRKIKLMIKGIKTFERSPTIGQNLTYWCDYSKFSKPTKNFDKFICKGEDRSICQPLWSTTKPNTTTGKLSVQDDKEKRNITITVRNVTTNDTGTYWCGAETNDNTRSKLFYHKFLMTVETPQPESGSQIEKGHA